MDRQLTTENTNASLPTRREFAQQKKAQGGVIRRLLLPVFITLSGLVLLLYPVVATQLNNYEQRQASIAFEKSKQEVAPEVINEELERAKQYNATREDGPILDPWLSRVSADNTDYQEYLKQLSTLPSMGRLLVPSVKIDLPILHGTTPDTLERGVGHLYGSDLPIGGEGNHSILTGHTGLPTATLFDELVNVKKGDDIFLFSVGDKMRYVVDDIVKVLPSEADALYAKSDQDRITLITCTPYGLNTHRLLVMAHREPIEAEHEALVSDDVQVLWPTWMIGILGVVAVVLLGLIVWVIMMVRRYSAQQTSPEAETEKGDAQ